MICGMTSHAFLICLYLTKKNMNKVSVRSLKNQNKHAVLYLGTVYYLSILSRIKMSLSSISTYDLKLVLMIFLETIFHKYIFGVNTLTATAVLAMSIKNMRRNEKKKKDSLWLHQINVGQIEGMWIQVIPGCSIFFTSVLDILLFS